MTLLSGIVIAGIGISIMITKSVTKPIDDMKKTAERLGRGELEARATLGNLEEINILSRTFNKMSDEISALMEKTKKEKKARMSLDDILGIVCPDPGGDCGRSSDIPG